MRLSWNSVVTVVLTASALVCSIITAYIFSIQWWGEWRYRELILPMYAFAIGGIVALVGLAAIRGRQCDRARILRSILMLGVCYTGTAGLAFGVMASCNISCGERKIEGVKSPSGQWTAVWSLQNCAAIARYCPPISHVRILRTGETLSDSQEVFGITADRDLRLEWKSDNLLEIWYPGGEQILRKDSKAGTVQIEYLPVGWM